jgi:uncharacterized membrane protein YozB (DUF420 family)
MKLINSDTYKDLSKVCLDIAKYVITVAILAPFFKNFENPKAMYLIAFATFFLVLLLYLIFNYLSKNSK